jgi:hypothetical protein
VTVSTIEVPDIAAVEVLDWTPRWSLGSMAANFARMQVLITLFDGDPDKWLDMIERTGSAEYELDVPFLAVMKKRLAEDPELIGDMRRIVGEFAARLSSSDAVE